MTDQRPRIAYLTSGAAGMYCGSCMSDNTLARALTRLGVDIQLIPTYTPIRTDEENVSIDRVYFGGVNVFLQQKIPLFRYLPAIFDRFLDQPWLIRRLTARAEMIDARELGSLTVSMLRGENGHQRKEVRRLTQYLERTVQPELVVLSNMLIAGCVESLKRRLGVPILVTLQGDDIFLDSLTESSRGRAMDEIRRLVSSVDGFIVHSRYYADFMSDYFGLAEDKVHVTPLGLETEDFARLDEKQPREGPPTIGYLARLAPEKGLSVLIDAFIHLRKTPGMQDARLLVAGWLGENNRRYAEAEFQKLRDAGLQDAYEYVGEVDRAGKIEFLRRLDIFSAPTIYREPKGLFVLESLAAGTPVLQPEHGAFPELLAETGGGQLVRPDDPLHLAEELRSMLCNRPALLEYGRRGRRAVLERRDSASMARGMLEIYRQYLPD